jgi:hypothetical protein
MIKTSLTLKKGNYILCEKPAGKEMSLPYKCWRTTCRLIETTGKCYSVRNTYKQNPFETELKMNGELMETKHLFYYFARRNNSVSTEIISHPSKISAITCDELNKQVLPYCY